MTEVDHVSAWVAGYVRAWNSNEPGEIGALFADDAVYRPEPHAEPWVGRERIVAEWLGRRDKPGETTFEWRPVALDGDVAVIAGTTTYPTRTFSNLWVLRFAGDGRCRDFTEYWMQHPTD
jgi:hypothetical protein